VVGRGSGSLGRRSFGFKIEMIHTHTHAAGPLALVIEFSAPALFPPDFLLGDGQANPARKIYVSITFPLSPLEAN